MSDTPTVEPGNDRCTYPGCTRPRRPDPATGRPTRYCEQADNDGGPVHTRVTAWKARQAQQGTVTTQDPASTTAPASAPVSLARATLEQHLAELPDKLAEQRRYLDALVDAVRSASDLEAAGAEVEDAHRDALAKVVDAERRAVDAERIARAATVRAESAESDRAEADAIAADALAETARVRDDARDEVRQIRATADAEIAQARDELAAATAQHETAVAQHHADLQQARDEAVEARAATAATAAALEASETRARETIAELRADLESARSQAHVCETAEAAVRVELATAAAEARLAQTSAATDRENLVAALQELERQRTDFHAERDAQRAAHAQQVEYLTHSADERVQALADALTAAREVADTYRAQLTQSKRSTRRSAALPTE